jgi:outer membrane receptor for ferrienterochelin and colicin
MKYLQLLALIVVPVLSFSQTRTVSGTVIDGLEHPISQVKVSVLNQNFSTMTDSLGEFILKEVPESEQIQLVFEHPDFKVDTLTFKKTKELVIELDAIQKIPGFKYTEKGNNRSSHLTDGTLKTEVISSGELKKAACCDLAGCFETQATVQAMTTNIITNSKELRIMGLSGVYNQVLVDGMPLIQGLTYTYGISSYPGTLVDNIYVSKGTSSVLQGFESFVGQINIVPQKPAVGEKLLLNAYVNSFGEHQYNANYRMGKGQLYNILSVHSTQPAQKWDRDKDGFLDLPKVQRYMIYDKLSYGTDEIKTLSAILSMRYVWEERLGGQVNYDPKKDLGSNLVYGQKVNYTQPDFYLKTAYRFNKNQKLAFYTSGMMHDQNSWLGTVNYKAKQQNLYSNLQFENTWRSNHNFIAGVSNRYLSIDENIQFSDTSLKRTYAGDYLKLERIPGVFAENTFKWRGDILTLITGIRADHHNQFGWQVTPRAMVKYEVTDNSSLRASAGTAWRTVNLFSENIGLLVTSRDIVFAETLNPEKGMNWGVNWVQKFKRKNIDGFLTADFYQTRFQNQFFPDYDTDPSKAYIANFNGTSVSNGFQVDVNVKFHKMIEVKTAYNFLDVYRQIGGSKFIMPFNPRNRALLAISYVAKSKKWRADMNSHWFGEMRLPNTDMNPEEYRQAKYSKPYQTINLQVSRNWKQLELYAGCENLFDFRQLRPIVSWQNPFSPYFDTSFNWGPTRGREIYVGLRYKPRMR